MGDESDSEAKPLVLSRGLAWLAVIEVFSFAKRLKLCVYKALKAFCYNAKLPGLPLHLSFPNSHQKPFVALDFLD
jgi:hypothetical protein